MTTVGYGDKVPQTIAGKIVGMIWTILGLSLISMFIASITTILGEIISGTKVEHVIYNTKVGVIRESIERLLVLQEGGNPVGISEIDS